VGTPDVMRAGLGLLALALLVGTAACHRGSAKGPSALVAISAPQTEQAPGLWEERIFDRQGVRRFRYCLDARAARDLAAFDSSLNSRCARSDMAEAADGSWRFATRCDMGPWGEVTSEGVMRGDFFRHYQIDVRTDTVHAANPRANGLRRVVADMRRLGDCPRKMKPGQIVTPKGGVFRLRESAPTRA
jgi:hypothetical protein